MEIRRKAKDTLTAVEMFHGDTLVFTKRNGETVHLDLESTGAQIVETTLKRPGKCEPGATTIYRFWADFKVNGEALSMEREVGTQNSFYEPWEIAGLRIWLDAVDASFEFMRETHGLCRPRHTASGYLPPHYHARLAVQDASLSICPEKLVPWCPLPEKTLRIEDCYRGEDCWMGAYDGASAHGGLDINHPTGTPLFAPIDLDEQFLYNSLEMGHNNNRWRGIRRWADGAQWILASAHMVEMTAPDSASMKRGEQYAKAAGVWIGVAEHSHFAFAVVEYGEMIRLDPWILFWQMYRDLG